MKLEFQDVIRFDDMSISINLPNNEDIDITYTNATGGSGGSAFEIAEYGFYNISVFDWAVQISNVTESGSSTFIANEFLAVEKFRLSIQVQTVGHNNWNTIDFIDYDITYTQGSNDWTFRLGRSQDNNRLVNFDKSTEEIGFTLKLK